MSKFSPADSLDQLKQLGIVFEPKPGMIQIDPAYNDFVEIRISELLNTPSYTAGLKDRWPDPNVAYHHLSTQVDILIIMEYMGGRGQEDEIANMAAVVGRLRSISHEH